MKYYVFTLTGLGVYKLYRPVIRPANSPAEPRREPFRLLVDGHWQELDPARILYVESLENYVRVFIPGSTLVSRLTLKQATQELPAYFVRVSRSHVVNLRHVREQQGEALLVGHSYLPIGRTYKQYVAERLKQQAQMNH